MNRKLNNQFVILNELPTKKSHGEIWNGELFEYTIKDGSSVFVESLTYEEDDFNFAVPTDEKEAMLFMNELDAVNYAINLSKLGFEKSWWSLPLICDANNRIYSNY